MMIVVSLKLGTAVMHGKTVVVTKRGAVILNLLNAQAVVPTHTIVLAIWGSNLPGNEIQALRHTIHLLRKRIIPHRYDIESVYGVGYRLVDLDEEGDE